MKILEFLKTKSAEVVTIDIGNTIGAAAEKMAAHRIAALVMTDQDRPVGVVSEHDIVAAVAEEGSQAGGRPLSMLVKHAINSIRPEDTLNQAMAIMTNSRMRHLPVLSDERLVGIISLGDIVKSRLDELSLERDVLRDMYLAAH